MSVGETSGPIHPKKTQSGKSYLFYSKHHLGRKSDAAQWAPDMTHDDEFAVFDDADRHETFDERGWLYGVRRYDTTGKIPDLGMRGEQVAEFPLARPDEPWHGYPVWAIDEGGPANRRGEQGRPSKTAFLNMEKAGLLKTRDRKRLAKGNHA